MNVRCRLGVQVNETERFSNEGCTRTYQVQEAAFCAEVLRLLWVDAPCNWEPVLCSQCSNQKGEEGRCRKQEAERV